VKTLGAFSNWQVGIKIERAGRNLTILLIRSVASRCFRAIIRSVGISSGRMFPPSSGGSWIRFLANLPLRFALDLSASPQSFLSQAIARLQDFAGAAVTTVLKIMLDSKTPAGTQLRAAEVVL